MSKQIESCKNCMRLIKLSNLDEMIKEDGECLVDEETKRLWNDNYVTEGKKEYELICTECKSSWVYQKHWITDNGGEGIKRNGVDIDF